MQQNQLIIEKLKLMSEVEREIFLVIMLKELENIRISKINIER